MWIYRNLGSRDLCLPCTLITVTTAFSELRWFNAVPPIDLFKAWASPSWVKVHSWSGRILYDIGSNFVVHTAAWSPDICKRSDPRFSVFSFPVASLLDKLSITKWLGIRRPSTSALTSWQVLWSYINFCLFIPKLGDIIPLFHLGAKGGDETNWTPIVLEIQSYSKSTSAPTMVYPGGARAFAFSPEPTRFSALLAVSLVRSIARRVTVPIVITCELVRG
jgi:hypothetical protein